MLFLSFLRPSCLKVLLKIIRHAQVLYTQHLHPGTSKCNSFQRLRRKPVPNKPYGFCGRYARHHVYLRQKARLSWRESRLIVKLPPWWSAELTSQIPREKTKQHHHHRVNNNNNNNKTTETTTQWSRLNRRTGYKLQGNRHLFYFLTRTDYPRCNLGLGKTNSLPLVSLWLMKCWMYQCRMPHVCNFVTKSYLKKRVYIHIFKALAKPIITNI